MNENLHAAKQAKNDEFYTQPSDIEAELQHYEGHFAGKIVYCNCDSPDSAFVHYFQDNFKRLKLCRLLATGYVEGGKGTFLSYAGEEDGPEVMLLEGDGDFRSEECIELLEQADVIVTNPPFSLFREYLALLVKYGHA